ncbi:MAG TPA: heme exporter protein CcmB [Candidatus Limnocylindria bacterium]|nr:heme exporter protein CcmB [Candidatus Limnocylindria bacterium]
MTIGRIILVAARDLRAERGQPDGLIAAVTFTAVLILLESLVVGPLTARQPAIAAALFWIAMSFAAILAAARSFDRDLEDDAIDAVLVLPGGRDALFAGKALALAATVAVVAAVGGALSLVLLSLDVSLPLHLALVTLLGVFALPPVIVLDIVLALRLRARAALVPILALPVLVPQLVAASNGTAAALTGDATGALAWSGLLLAFGILYAVLGLALGPAAID